MSTMTEVFEAMGTGVAIAPPELARLSEALSDAEQAASACASAMIKIGGMAVESEAALDSIDVLFTTRQVLTRSGDAGPQLPKLMLEATIASCDRCAKLCGDHADHFDHCRLHAEASRAAADRAREVLALL